MLVMKFGGASVKDAASMKNVAEIIGKYLSESCLIVISAAGKTTNNLETLSELASQGKATEAEAQYQEILDYHLQIVEGLFGQVDDPVRERVLSFFYEIKHLVQGIIFLEEFSDRIYDRIVAYGELISTAIVAAYLQHKGYNCNWIDARKIVKTDANHKQAGLIWSLTEQNIQNDVLPLMGPGKVVITQGFIGSTTSEKTTTLGREGSDYTASIFAHCLNASRLIVWKDVAGILNGDPRIRENTVKIDKLSYEEAIEMTFYGATVIHPKTIQPLYNKQIPLYVKCFLDTEAEGSCISEQSNESLITSYILKKNQSFIRIRPRDFSFMDERLMEVIFNHVYKTGLKANLVQNSAISLLLCVDNDTKTVNAFESLLLDDFFVEMFPGLHLHTIINFTLKDLKLAEDSQMVQQNGNKLYIVK